MSEEYPRLPILCDCCGFLASKRLIELAKLRREWLKERYAHNGVNGILCRLIWNDDCLTTDVDALIDEIYCYFMVCKEAAYPGYTGEIPNERSSKLPGFIEYLTKYITKNSSVSYIVATYVESIIHMSEHGTAIRCSYLREDYKHPRPLNVKKCQQILLRLMADGYTFVSKEEAEHAVAPAAEHAVAPAAPAIQAKRPIWITTSEYEQYCKNDSTIDPESYLIVSGY